MKFQYKEGVDLLCRSKLEIQEELVKHFEGELLLQRRGEPW